MSRPKNPSITIPTWLSGVSYPSGTDPWSGTPMAVTPASDHITPNTTLPAQYLNWLFQQAYTGLSGLLQSAQDFASYSGTGAAQNWKAQVPITTITGSGTAPAPMVMRWMPQNSAWVVFGKDDPAHVIKSWFSYDGMTWAPATTSLGSATSITATIEFNGTIWAYGSTGYQSYSASLGSLTGTWSSIGLWSSHIGISTFNVNAVVNVGGTLWLFGNDGSSASYIFSTTDNNTFTGRGFSNPIFTANRTWTASTDGSNVVIAGAKGYAPCNVIVENISGGTTTVLNPCSTNTETAVKITYDTADGLFFLLTTTGLYSTVDGTVWTNRTHPALATDLSACGSMLVAVRSDKRLVFSVDSGTTWRFVPFQLSAADTTFDAIHASDTQFGIIGDGGCYFSNSMGLPPVAAY